jgi:hypothetical protein
MSGPLSSAEGCSFSITGFRATRTQIARLRYLDGPGPALLSREIYAEAGHLHGDAGARLLSASHPEWVHEIPVERPAPPTSTHRRTSIGAEAGTTNGG